MSPTEAGGEASQPGADQMATLERRHYGMATLIRGTLVGLYLALVLPLPLLASGGLRPLRAGFLFK